MTEPILKVENFTVEFWVDGVWYPAAIDMNFERFYQDKYWLLLVSLGLVNRPQH
jgi:hypothetical protein